MTPSRTLWGSWAQRFSVSPCVLITGHRLHSAPMTFPEFQRAGSNRCSSGKGGDAQTREEKSKETTVQPWGRVLVSQRAVNFPQQARRVLLRIHLRSTPQPGGCFRICRNTLAQVAAAHFPVIDLGFFLSGQSNEATVNSYTQIRLLKGHPRVSLLPY